MGEAKKTAVITGANTGLGYEMAAALGRDGYRVFVVGRNRDKVEAALGTLVNRAPEGQFEAGIVDLNDLASVRQFGALMVDRLPHLDVLINNAGIMVPPAGVTMDGFETQFGVNFVAHFVLTGLLMPLLEASPGGRVVSLSSIASRSAAIDFDNLRLEKPYDQWREYGQSKLADLIFALELERRLRGTGSKVQSLAAHPGVSQTELTRNLGGVPPGITLMSAAEGAAPALVAATSPDATGGQYWGPDGPEERSGKPGLATIAPLAQDTALGTRLWEWAQNATGVTYP